MLSRIFELTLIKIGLVMNFKSSSKCHVLYSACQLIKHCLAHLACFVENPDSHTITYNLHVQCFYCYQSNLH